MRALRWFSAVIAICVLAFTTSTSAADTATDIPHLQKRGSATQLIVEGKPFLILGGELQNSSASSLSYMQPLWPKLTAMHLNTVLAPVSWELIEPTEGKFDFTLVDGLITAARQNHLRLVFLWFGSWKNTYSSYVPEWAKRDIKRFPRVETLDGRRTERLSPFSANGQTADSRAFAALMRHIREFDATQQTVIMVQVENEVGVIPEPRDHSQVAEAAFAAPVPKPLIDYLRAHADTLAPELAAAWTASGRKISGTWRDVFGPSSFTDDLFMAWHYARYIDAVTAAGKTEYPLPMFVNAALIRPNYEPGQYNSGGPLPHSIDFWRAAGPHIDFLSPDVYFDNFAYWSHRFNLPGNPLFVPEAHAGDTAAANALYAIGQQNSIGFSPFAIDSPVKGTEQGGFLDKAVAETYAALAQLSPQILEAQASGHIATAILEGDAQRFGKLPFGEYMMTINRADGVDKSARVAVMFLQTGPDEYIVTGAGKSLVTFAPNTPGLPTAGIASIDEEVLIDGKWQRQRRLNGDENSQGQQLKVNDRSIPTIYRVRLYRY